MTLRNRVKRTRVYMQFLVAVRCEYPLWFNRRLNPTPLAERFRSTLTELTRALEQHCAALGRNVEPPDALDVMAHLLRKWPGGFLGYNQWWGTMEAQRLGLLDGQFRPVTSARFVDDEHMRRHQLLELGGPGALGAYDRVFRGES
jgi:hypothetical protein